MKNKTMKDQNRKMAGRQSTGAAASDATPVALGRGEPEKALEQLKNRLCRRMLDEGGQPHPELEVLVKHSATEAAAIAWTTPFPLLALPVLLEEKTVEARQRFHKQKEVRRRSRALILSE